MSAREEFLKWYMVSDRQDLHTVTAYLDAIVAEARADALEEAAVKTDKWTGRGWRIEGLSDDIRALKGGGR